MAKATYAMTLSRLLRNGLTHARLQALFESSESTLDFYDRLKQIGIDRKAAKSMAARLISSGLMCRGGIEKEAKSEASDCQNEVTNSEYEEDNNIRDTETEMDRKVTRTDSRKDCKINLPDNENNNIVDATDTRSKHAAENVDNCASEEKGNIGHKKGCREKCMSLNFALYLL